MANDVLFPEQQSSYVFERDCLAFKAVADGKPFECVVTAVVIGIGMENTIGIRRKTP